MRALDTSIKADFIQKDRAENNTPQSAPPSATDSSVAGVAKASRRMSDRVMTEKGHDRGPEVAALPSLKAAPHLGKSSGLKVEASIGVQSLLICRNQRVSQKS